MIIAVDFDGTLCDDKFPEIGEPHTKLINDLVTYKREHEDCRLVLWTCRCEQSLQNAVNWCKLFGLEFDEVNASVPEHLALYDTDSRKVFADLYIEDKAVDWKDFDPSRY